MEVIDTLSSVARSVLSGIKHVVGYSAQLFTYIVTLGHAEFPRFKRMNNTAEVDNVKQSLEEREVTIDPRTKGGNDFLRYLEQIEPGQGEVFKGSQEYKEYMKDTNPFSFVCTFYQKYKARIYLESLAGVNKKDFFQSPEYKNYLASDPKNPFSETIEVVYDNYQKALAERLRTRMEEFESQVYDLFRYYENMGEGFVKEGFIKSEDYLKSLEKMKTDIEFSFSLEDVKEAYDNFKKRIPEENKKFLNSLGDKNQFMDSAEYKKISQRPLLVPNDLEDAHNKYTTRVYNEKAMGQFVDDLRADSKKFDKLSKSKEYLDVIINPFHTLEELKLAVNEFEKRNFLEEFSDNLRQEFIKSEHYKNIINNPFSTLFEFETAFNIWNTQRQEAERREGLVYLEELKKALNKETGNDTYYEQFTQSQEYYANSLTLEGMKSAFEAFQQKNPRTWGQYFFGG